MDARDRAAGLPASSVVVLLHKILFPFVAGMALAYVLDPLVHRLERIGVNRAVAALAIIGLFFFAFGYLFGFVGLLIAVPLAAAIGVLVRLGLKQYAAGAPHPGQAQPATEVDQSSP
jgi:predicted PurR-regulated permease PerM